jgi:hypothetical protein
MKSYLLIIIAIVFSTNSLWGQDSGKLGEDFDLEALAGVIEKVNSFEELEKAINNSSYEVNNLDLDKNNEVDYIIIQEEADGNTHVAYLRIATSQDEFQEIASIEMEKLSSSTASYQIVGDATMYGEDYILEPEGGIVDISRNSEPNPSGGKGGPSPYFHPPLPAVHVTIVTGVYSPGYVVYVSPYGFMVVPAYYHPWVPVARSTYRARTVRWHRSAYRRSVHRRSHHAHSMHKKHYNTNKATHYGTSPASKNTQPSNNKNNQQKKSTTNTQTKPSTQKKKGSTPQKKRK